MQVVIVVETGVCLLIHYDLDSIWPMNEAPLRETGLKVDEIFVLIILA